MAKDRRDNKETISSNYTGEANRNYLETIFECNRLSSK